MNTNDRGLFYAFPNRDCSTLNTNDGGFFRLDDDCDHAGEVHKWENDFEKPNDKFIEMIEDVVDKVMLLDEPAAQVD